MRAERQAQSTTVTAAALPSGQAAVLLYRLLMALVATLALLMVWRPRVVYAQSATPTTASAAGQAATTTHVVKPGETLWSLAARYYGDGHKWQDLAKRNGIPATDGAPLRVGMKLTVPAGRLASGAKAAATAAAPADSTVPRAALAKAGEGTLPTPAPAARSARPAQTGGSLASQTAGKGNAAAGAASGRTNPRATATGSPARPASTAASTPAASAASAAASAGGQLDTSRANLKPQVGTMLGERGATRIGLVDQTAQAASRKGGEVETIFHRDIPDAAEAERRTQAALRPNVPAVRQAEYDAAPFVIADAAVRSAGEIVRRRGASASRDATYPQRAIKTDEVELRAPAGTTYQVGDRLVSFVTQNEDRQARGGLVAVPTGVLEVTRVEGGVVVAEVKRQAGGVEQGQRLVAAAGTAAPRVRTERLPAPDVSTTVVWLDRHELLPTLSSYLLLGAGSAQGLKAGDEVALYVPATGSSSEVVAATARVVRVEAGTSAAVIVSQNSREIMVGMTARRFAKSP